MGDRPVECSHCKRPIAVIYKEITQDSTIVTEMCSECPVLQRKLHGVGAIDAVTGPSKEKPQAGVFCGTCDTNLDWIKMGNALGCSECYDVFSEILLSQLLDSDKVSARLRKNIESKKFLPLHLGKSPKKFAGVVPSEKLTSLNEALKEALKKENYEQAAWLRDQIKALLEKKKDD